MINAYKMSFILLGTCLASCTITYWIIFLATYVFEICDSTGSSPQPHGTLEFDTFVESFYSS